MKNKISLLMAFVLILTSFLWSCGNGGAEDVSDQIQESRPDESQGHNTSMDATEDEEESKDESESSVPDVSEDEIIPDDIIFDPTQRLLEYKLHDVPCPVGAYIHKNQVREENFITDGGYVIKDWDSFTNVNRSCGFALSEFQKTLPENFFNTKVLLFGVYTKVNPKAIYSLSSVWAGEDGITMYLDYILPPDEVADIPQYTTSGDGVFCVELSKRDVANLDSFNIVSTQKLYPVGGTDAVYNTEDRQISFKSYDFTYFLDKEPFEFAVIRTKKEFSSFIGDGYAFNSSGADLEKFYNSYDYGNGNLLVAIFMGSDNPDSYFKLSDITADENGVMIGIEQQLDPSTKGKKKYQVLVAEIPEEQILGVDLFRLTIASETDDYPFLTLGEKPEKWQTPDPEPERYDGGKTARKYGSDITEEKEYIGLDVFPIYVNIGTEFYAGSSYDRYNLQRKNVEIYLYDGDGKLVCNSFTNRNGVARLICRTNTDYYICCKGDEEYFAYGLLEDGSGNTLPLLSAAKRIRFDSPMETAKVRTETIYLTRRTEEDMKLTQFAVLDGNGAPIPNATVVGEGFAIQTNNDGLIFCREFYIRDLQELTAKAEGYIPNVIRSDNVKNRSIMLEMPQFTEYVFNFTDKESGLPITGDLRLTVNINGEAIECYEVDENGSITVKIDNRILEEHPVIRVSGKHYYRYEDYYLHIYNRKVFNISLGTLGFDLEN